MKIPLFGAGARFRSNAAHARAFTFIDALGVVGAVGILAATVMPPISTSKQKQAIGVDFNNMRRLTMACQLYALDNGGYEPAPGWDTQRTSWIYTANPPFSYSGQLNSLRNAQLWPYLKSTKVFLCPTDTTNNPTWTERVVLTTSYVMNGAVAGYGVLPNGRSYKSSQFLPDRVLFFEADRNQPFYFNNGANFPDEGIGNTHEGGGVLGDFGGQAEFASQLRYYSSSMAGAQGLRGVGIHGQFLPNRLWCSPGDRYGR